MAEREQGRRSDLLARILWALPAIAFASFIDVQGGLVFALAIGALGVVALGELYTLMARVRPVNLAGFVTIIALVVAADRGDPDDVIKVLAASFLVTFYLSFLRPRREHVSYAIAVTLFGVFWIGIPLVHAVFLRDLSHGDGLIVDVLVGTFLGDTAAYVGGRVYGSRHIAPVISPNKTLEGLIAGILGGTLGCWFAGLYQDWLSGADALILGLAVAVVAPMGDLFESTIKRDLDVKDTGRFVGAHGGVLDRLDAALFTVVAGYYVAVALGYG